MSKSDTNGTQVEWTPENEIKLFYAMRGHKPVGVAKNFHMICILDEFVKLTDKEITSKIIWNRLETMYDMETLHDNEDMPFPNVSTPFNIEDNPEFSELFAKKSANNCKTSEKESEPKEEMETSVSTSTPKTATKGKTHDLNKSNSKVKSENEKNSKSDRKEESTKQSEKSDESEDKTIVRSKKHISKQTTELRSSAHSTPSSAKKRK
ncbi:unnamed protein product [Medioppia subpectinata]|uniref:Chromatin modification-related protein EAF7 n=1 Tax=Medioppia subpectinata TaxID=1979941 RepID=A0A7R9KFK8_9ACAR|nr:unnamed protein product [Medioppia subpectinata]CAG2101424.1 unnamed protein product [Medioppia subpectinata]